MLGDVASAPIVRAGYLKKLKTGKKKFFVLRAETCDLSSRLEYHDTVKKFNCGQPPKRSIPLKSCFNINKRVHNKYKYVIALYTKDDCFSIILDSEEELEAWLKALLSQQRGEEMTDGQTLRPTFEHVWQVRLMSRGLGCTPIMLGTDRIVFTEGDGVRMRLCLTDRVLSLISHDNEYPPAEFLLSQIRSCGFLKQFFFLEAGRLCFTGSGEIWMETEDTHIALNVHQTVYHAMVNNCRNELGPRSRFRSSSATESSKPKTVKIITASGKLSVQTQQQASVDPRVRCDSMPSARSRTTSEGHHTMDVWNKFTSFLIHRPQSRDVSHSPPSGSPMSPPSAACSTDSAGSSLSIDETETGWHEESHKRFATSLTPDEVIAEENCDDCTDGPCVVHSSPTSGYVPMGPPIAVEDGYINMSPRVNLTNMSPAASTSSVTSGTPSTDIRFAEFPLEKVTSYLTEEDETSSTERPRTYSMGSKPYKAARNDNRDRAWSFGSKGKKAYNRVLQQYTNSHSQHSGPKSRSAPLLSSTRLNSSHSSMDPMDDLMEMDFSRQNSNSVESTSNKNTSKTPPGYVDMHPGGNHKPMDTTPYVDMTSASKKRRGDYVEMDKRRGTGFTIPSTSPMNPSISVSPHSSIASTSPRTTDYMEMNFQRHADAIVSSPTKSSGYIPTGSPSSMDYMDMVPQNHPDGYMEMSLGAASIGNYTNMTSSASKKSDRHKSKVESSRSQPITIQNAPPQKDTHIFGNRKIHLPFLSNSSYSSLPRQQRSRKNSRRDSKDSSSSSVTTPSNSSTIFPISLNSPSSPMNQENNATNRVPPTAANVKYTTGVDNSGYTRMDFKKTSSSNSKTSSSNSDYVNYNPALSDVTLQISAFNLTERCYNPMFAHTEDGDLVVYNSRPSTLNVGRNQPLHYASLDLNEDQRSSRCTEPFTGYARINFEHCPDSQLLNKT